MRFFQATLLLVFLGSVAAFALQNNRPVSVGFLVWRASPPRCRSLIVGVYLLPG